MANNASFTLNSSLQGRASTLIIESFDSNFTTGSNNQIKLANDVSIANDLTIGNDFTVNGTMTADKISIDEFVFPDNNANGLKFTSADTTDYMIFVSTDGSEQIKVKKDIFFENSNALKMGTSSARGNIEFANLINSVISGSSNTITLLNFKDNQTSATNAGSVCLGSNGGFFWGYAQDLSDKPTGTDANSNDLGSFYVKKSANGTANFFLGEVGTLGISKCRVGEIASGIASSGENSAVITHEDFLGGSTNQIEMTATGNIFLTTPNDKNIYLKCGIDDPVIKPGNVSTSDSDFNFILLAPRPNTSSGGATMFINGSSRSADGGNNTLTFRNDSGAMVLGKAGTSTSENIDIQGNTFTAPVQQIDFDIANDVNIHTTNGVINLQSAKTGTGLQSTLGLDGNPSDSFTAISLTKPANRYVNIIKKTTSSGSSDVNLALHLNNDSTDLDSGVSFKVQGSSNSDNLGANCFIIDHTDDGDTLYSGTGSHCFGTTDVAPFTGEPTGTRKINILSASGASQNLNSGGASCKEVIKIRDSVGGNQDSLALSVSSRYIGNHLHPTFFCGQELGASGSARFNGVGLLAGDSVNNVNTSSTPSRVNTVMTWQGSLGCRCIPNAGVASTNGNAGFELDVAGEIECISITQTSDERAKTNFIQPTDDEQLEKILQVQAWKYEWKDATTVKNANHYSEIGCKGQELNAIEPRFCNISSRYICNINRVLTSDEYSCSQVDGEWRLVIDDSILEYSQHSTGSYKSFKYKSSSSMLDFKNTEQENGYYVVNENITYLFVLGILVDDFVSVDYGRMTPYLAGSIRYLKNIIDQQQTTINSLTTTQINLLSRIQALEN